MKVLLIPSLSLAAAAFVPCRAEVKLPSVFNDHMVLQQRMKIPVWGWAGAAEPVAVALGDTQVKTVADLNGKWRVDLPARPASDTPVTLEVTGTNRLVVSDVLIGEVWICSGQSNMERQLGPRAGQPLIDNWEQERDAADYPRIRHFAATRTKAAEPASDVVGKWQVCSPATVADFTAVGYFFGRDLQQSIKVPIGLIHSSWGGTAAEVWTSRATQLADPELRGKVERFDQSVREFPEQLEQFERAKPDLLAKHAAAVAAAKLAAQPEPKPPVAPGDPLKTGWPPGSLYNGMISPLMPFAMRGVIWYQGESNNGNPAAYRKLFPSMIKEWRRGWGQGDFPFLFVQIAPFPQMSPDLREAQLQAWKNTVNTAMVVTTDVGFVANIHPPHKQPVGARLALAARALAYGERIEYSGPQFDSVKVKGGQAAVSFAHLGGGLVAKDGELRGFEVAGADRQFVPAKAVIRGNQVLVSSDPVAKPVHVRYGWANVPDVNLYNQQGLPASPFRSDESTSTLNP